MQQHRYLNFLKGIAIFGVILVHSPQKIMGLDPYIQIGVHFGAFGCQLFFLISGYLTIASWHRIKDNRSPIYSFYRKRFLSIAPIYIVFVILYQLLAYLSSLGGVRLPFYICRDTISVIVNMLLLQGLDYSNFNNVVPGGWFIGTITLFYVLFPLLYKIHRKLVSIDKWIGPYLLTGMSVLLSFIVQYILMKLTGDWKLSKPGSYIYYSILNQLPCLTLGMALNDIKANSEDISKYLVVFVIGFTITNILYVGLRLHYWINCFIPLGLGISFIFLYLGIRNYYKRKENLKKFNYIEQAGIVSYSAYFTNFLACWIFPWGIQIILNNYRVDIDPLLLYVILLIPIFILTFILVPPVDFIIKVFKRVI